MDWTNTDRIGLSRRLLTNSSLRIKALWLLGVTMGLFVLTAGGFLLNQEQVRDARQWTDHTTEVLALTDDLQLRILEQESNLRGFVASRRDEFLAPYRAASRAFDATAARLLALTTDNVEQQARLHRIVNMMAQWRDEIASVEIDEIQIDRNGAASELVASGRGKQLTDAIQTQIRQAADAEQALLNIRNRTLSRQLANIRQLAIASLILGFVFCALALVVVQRSLATPMRDLTDRVARLTEGDLEIDVPHTERGDELGAIARAIEAFRKASQDVKKREWQKHHLAALGSELSQHHDYRRFGDAALAYLCPLLGVGYGVLLSRRDDDDSLRPIGSYGVQEGHDAARSLRDGLAAECLRSGKPITLAPVPADYLRIASALGDAIPGCVRLWPLPGLNRIVGVLELATFTTFDEATEELLEEAMRPTGLALEALGNAIRTHELLDETRAQAEELQASEEALRVQQEELRTANEALGAKNTALEDQGRRLRVSEEELRVQTEELRNANETLADKSRALNEFNERLLAFQQALETKNHDLEQASRYKSEFLANMSHELRTPLNSLLILAKDLADNDSGNLTPEQVESAQIVHESGQNLLGLINDILDLSKIEAGRMDVDWEDVALDAIGNHAERGFRRVAQDRGLAFSIDVAAGLPSTIRSDGTRLMQIITNLLGNAFKFTHSGAVRLSITRPDDTLPALGDGSRAQTLALTVSDSGIGIPEEKLARLFQPFEQGDGTTSRRYGGTGLGLSISRALAQMLGGEIVVRSTPGSGSQFTLLLPEDGSRSAGHDATATAVAMPAAPAIVAPAPETAMAVPAAQRSAAIADDRDHLQPGDVRVLVVEDDGAFARVLAEMARRKGYRALVASDGESGLELARRYRPNGILLDVDLPVMSGWTVMERLKEDAATRDIPVHFVTATDDASRGLAMGAVGFLTKPATRESLDAAFQRILKTGESEPRKVLVVEDDAGARHAVARLLAGQSIELAEAATAAQALQRLDEKAFDCIILDLTLPDTSGFEFLEQLARRGPLPPVVIYSARELSREEDLRLREYTDSIVIKGAHSPGRLLDEVSLFLHAVKKPSSPTPTAQQPSDLSGTVLVVDDDMRNVFALSKTLRHHGLKVLIAQDGYKALTQLEQNADVDWVLMDVMMPGMDGHEATREIRKRPEWRDLPVIAVTAKAMKGDREKCLEAGANDYLTKPIDIEKLLSMMRAWQRRG